MRTILLRQGCGQTSAKVAERIGGRLRPDCALKSETGASISPEREAHGLRRFSVPSGTAHSRHDRSEPGKHSSLHGRPHAGLMVGWWAGGPPADQAVGWASMENSLTTHDNFASRYFTGRGLLGCGVKW